MKNEEIKPVNPEDYKKEFAILDSLYGKFDFRIFKKPVLAESDLFCVLAWYMERLKISSKNWEEDFNTFIENAFKIDNVFDRYLYMQKQYLPMEIEHFKQISDTDPRAKLGQMVLDGLEARYERAKKIADEWKVKYKNRPAFMSELKKFF